MEIQLCEVLEQFQPYQSLPGILEARVEGRRRKTDIKVLRNLHDFRREPAGLSLYIPDLEGRERDYLQHVLFEGLALDENDGLTFDYSVNQRTKQRAYAAVLGHERGMLESKIEQTYCHCLPEQVLRRRIKEIGLELVWSDEDIATLPFLISRGTKTSRGVVASTTYLKRAFLDGKVDVVKPKFLEPLQRLYADLEKKYGVHVELELVERAA